MRTLLVEDDKIIGDGILKNLELEGYAVDWAEDKDSAETALETCNYDIMILDIGLPDGSGLDILKNIRRAKNNVPVLVLTAYDDISYKVKGLDSGADDYLVKPFKVEELTARLRALRRRGLGQSNPVLQAGDVMLDPAARKIIKGNKIINLGSKEFAILHALMEKKGNVLSKAQLEESLYSWESEIESNTVEVHIHGIRKKLGRDLIETIKFVGYRISL